MKDDVMPCGCSAGSCYCDGESPSDHHSEPDPTPERTILEAAANLLRRFSCPDDYTTRLAHHLSEDLRYFLACSDEERPQLTDATLGRCEHGALAAYCTADHTPRSAA